MNVPKGFYLTLSFVLVIASFLLFSLISHSLKTSNEQVLGKFIVPETISDK